MSAPNKPKTIDELCRKPAGSFSNFITQKNAFAAALEVERKGRIRVSRETARDLAWAA